MRTPPDRGKSKVLLGWELGGGSGHVRRLQRIAEALEGVGFEPVFALKQPQLLQVGNKWSAVQAPRSGEPVPPGFMAATFADLLACRGYSKVESLLPLVERWQVILDRLRPAIVVADYAPTLSLAARGRFPVVAVGTGFTMPPAQNGLFPRMSEFGRPLVPQEQILEAIQKVQQRCGRELLKSLSELMETEERFVVCMPELDPYGPLRTEPLIGPVEPMLAPSGAIGKKFFVYLKKETPDCEGVLTALAQSGFSGQAFVSGADTAMRKRIGKLGLEMHKTAVKPERIVGESAVIVHHGGSALAHLALAAGRPQLLFPAHLEHLLTARKLHGLGVAHALSGTFMASHVSEGLRQLMQDESFTRRAVSIAADIHSRGPWDALKKIVASCQRLKVNQAG